MTDRTTGATASSRDDPFAELGLPSVVNAAGKMTYLGSSAVSAAVAEALAAAAGSHVDMAALKVAANARAAELAAAPAACVVSSAAAGIVQAVAATVTRGDPALIEQVPFVDTLRRDVILQKSHAVHFGAPLVQMIRLGGGNPIEIGSANRTAPYHLEAALGPTAAAVVYAVTHHAHGETIIDLSEVVRIAHTHGVPVIVDAAAELDLHRYNDVGADLVVYSGHKAIGGPTSGLVLGQPDLVAATSRQEHGAGRAMKVGKETIAGLLCALQEYVESKGPSREQLEERLTHVTATAGTDVPVTFTTAWDKSRPIPRLRIVLADSAPLTALELVAQLEAWNPSIRTRNHDVASGIILVDPRELDLVGAREIGTALRKLLVGADATTRVGRALDR